METLLPLSIFTLMVVLGVVVMVIIRDGELLLNSRIVFYTLLFSLTLWCGVVFLALPSNYINSKLFSVCFTLACILFAYICRRERRMKPMQLCLGIGLMLNIVLFFISYR